MNIKKFLKDVESLSKPLLVINIAFYLISLVAAIGFFWSHVGAIIRDVSFGASAIISAVLVWIAYKRESNHR